MTSRPRDIMKKLKREMDKDLDSFFDEMKYNLAANTPIDKGRARRGWKKTGNISVDSPGRKTVIENQVPYIGVLDTGTSKQAPNGIVKPVLKKR